jgi:hypothetical protein
LASVHEGAAEHLDGRADLAVDHAVGGFFRHGFQGLVQRRFWRRADQRAQGQAGLMKTVKSLRKNDVLRGGALG